MLRYDGMDDPALSEDRHPTASVVPFDAVGEHLPEDDPTVGADERRRAIEQRREHVQTRFGY